MSSKRKASAASPQTIDLRPSKRQKTPVQSIDDDIASIGLRFIEQLRKASDKSGRQIATAFLELPDRDELPDYYDIIKLPIAINTIEEKLQKKQYPSLTHLESDVKRMVQNAKDYNEPSSDIYGDAERIRKNTHNFMKLANPAYKDPEYKAFPTPIPADGGPKIRLTNATAKAESKTPSRQPPPKVSAAAPAEEKQESDAMVIDEPAPTTSDDSVYKNLDFQQAQETLVQEMLDHVNEAGELDFVSIFGNLPSRSLEDYYNAIKNPQSLKKVMKAVKGWRSRAEQTGTTEFKTWETLTVEMSRIWVNAMDYNEDFSDVYKAAIQLEQYFKQRLAEAKKYVREPHASIKIKTGAEKAAAPPKSGLKLNLSTSQKQSPGPPSTASPALRATPQLGVTVDHAALQRQQADVKNAVNAASLAPPTASNAPTLLPGVVPPNDLPNGVQPIVNGAAPGVRPTSSSQSPFPVQQPGVGPLNSNQTQINAFDNKWRQEGREVLIRRLDLTSPIVEGSDSFSFSLDAHPKLAHQSVTINLPRSATTLQAKLDLTTTVHGTLGRPSKCFATANGMRVPQRVEPYGMANGAGNNKPPPPTFDIKLMPGMNRIELESVAVGLPKNGNWRGELEMERVYVYANVLKG